MAARELDGGVIVDDSTPMLPWTPIEAAGRMGAIERAGGVQVRWAVAGGWALDLFLGYVTRPHEDLEIVVLDDDAGTVLDAFRLPEWRWCVPLDGRLYPLSSPAFGESHQTWLWSEAVGGFVLDVFRDQHRGEEWLCRRDTTIRLPWTKAFAADGDGVPFLVPEIVLLFKAKHSRPKDVADLHAVLPALDDDRREWLHRSLRQVHPGHAWLDQV